MNKARIAREKPNPVSLCSSGHSGVALGCLPLESCQSVLPPSLLHLICETCLLLSIVRA